MPLFLMIDIKKQFFYLPLMTSHDEYGLVPRNVYKFNLRLNIHLHLKRCQILEEKRIRIFLICKISGEAHDYIIQFSA